MIRSRLAASTLSFRAALALAALVGGTAACSPVTTSVAPTPQSTGVGGGIAAGAGAAVCSIFPADNIWNTRIDTVPVDANSAAYITTIGASTGLHADFGAGQWNGGPIGIPSVSVLGSQALVPMQFYYASESDPGPYPYPPTAPIEGGASSTGDRHVLAIETDHCKLYETWKSYPRSGGTSWRCGSGATWDLSSNALRPAGWTSSDAAGLPVYPGLVRYDEIAAGEIRHAIRFTCSKTRNLYIWPARHFASSSSDPAYPPMGQRFRLKASFDVSSYSATNQIILNAMKHYGMLLADNGSNWYVSGSPDARWNDDDLHDLGRVTGASFEAINEASLMIDPNSGQARQ